MPFSIEFKKTDSIAFISIDRPASKNSLLPNDVFEFTKLIKEAGADSSFRVIDLDDDGDLSSGWKLACLRCVS